MRSEARAHRLSKQMKIEIGAMRSAGWRGPNLTVLTLRMVKRLSSRAGGCRRLKSPGGLKRQRLDSAWRWRGSVGENRLKFTKAEFGDYRTYKYRPQ